MVYPLLLILLLIRVAFAHTVPDHISRQLANLEISAKNTHTYIIFPNDPSLDDKNQAIEASLKEIVGTDNVSSQSSSKHEIDSWTILVERPAEIETVAQIPGVRRVEPEIDQKSEAAQAHGSRSIEIPREEKLTLGYLAAVAKDSFNATETAETKKFLETKVSNPGWIDTLTLPGDEIIGWSNLILSNTARKEVEEYPGITEVQDNPMIEKRLVPGSRKSNYQQKTKALSKFSAKKRDIQKRADQ
ncbi:hypothetical protein BDV95DRAFT_44373 [Massariosphaeria phaeospora]|uniref:Inhibitor I9 domain-containing protein n=1 Tax=Massariosphaeria phaeospora TaxID=100035 RepID=A0A7C8MEV1_9PLEO|nr:hypothetical protein BDV95DRAFT_44373 [Massariosphaeria phaeospora]